MKKFRILMAMAALLAIASMSTGCATVKKATGLFGSGTPDYAAALAQIQKILSGESTDTRLQGYTFTRTFFYQGSPVANPADITWKNKWEQTENASTATPPTTPTNEPPSSDAAMDMINDILDGAGLPK